MSEPVVTSGVAGWYGKLPNLGDFASRRLPGPFIDGWDDWLQRGLAAARDEPAWLERYLVAPILRFWLGPGLLGDGAWAGLVMPSVDRVGRHFPLTLARPAGALADTLAARAWFDRLDSAARKVLDVSFTVDDFERELAAIEADDMVADGSQCTGAPQSVWWRDDAQVQTFDGLPPAHEFSRLFAGEP
jgi:type VI secretion system protein ImpM